MFSLFRKKKNIAQTPLLEGMTDIHSHLLPGVDDGVQTTEEALRALEGLRDMGIINIYLTPHVMMDQTQNNREYLLSRFHELKKVCPRDIEIKLAAEYMLDPAIEQHIEDGLLTMKDNHVLVETSYLSPPTGFMDILYELSVEGYIPVLAHPERYRYMSVKDYAYLKEKGYKFQMNLFSLAGLYGLEAMKNSNYLLQQDLYDYAGSDIHSLHRYRKGIEHLDLTFSQQKQIKRIISNNSQLWE